LNDGYRIKYLKIPLEGLEYTESVVNNLTEVKILMMIIKKIKEIENYLRLNELFNIVKT